MHALLRPAAKPGLSTITVTAPNQTARTIAIVKGGNGAALAEATAAAMQMETKDLAGVKDTKGNVYSFDHVASSPAHFSQGTFELATAGAAPALAANKSAASLAPGSLSNVDPYALVSAFRQIASNDGTVSRDGFINVFKQIAPSRPKEEVLHLFQSFDVDRNGVLDFSEFVAGAVVLCGGDRDCKIKLSFDLLDTYGDGVLDLSEIKRYITSVFRVVQHSQPEVFATHGVTPESLAEVTAESAMAAADTDNDGVISFTEFRDWMLSGASAVPPSQLKRPSSLGSLEFIREVTGVGELSAEDVIDAMLHEANDRGVVDRKGFARAINSIARVTRRDPKSIPDGLVDALFDAVDTDGSGGCDIEELGSAFSVLCQGTRDERCIAAFELWDDDGDGYLSVSEMARLLTSVYKVLYASNPMLEVEMGVSPEQLGLITAQDAVESMDEDGDGRVSFAEFRKWYSKPTSSSFLEAPKVPTKLAQPPKATNALADSSWVSLDETRRLTGLGRFNPAVVMEAFAVVADEEGMVGKKEFLDTLRRLAPRNLSERDASRAKLVHNRLFELYAEGDRVDFSVLASALAMLSGGNAEDKKRSVFELMDIDQSGTVEREEFYRFMVSTMRVLYETQPGTRERIGVGPEELAAAVMEDAFERFDLNHDDRLTYEEFSKYWESDGAQDLVPMGDKSVSVSRPSSEATLEKTRALLGLDRYPIEDLFDTVAAAADHSGWISLAQFQRVLGSLARHNRSLDASQERELDVLLARLYETFDTDRDGSVDLVELAAGLSVLAGGSSDARAEAAFRLFQAGSNEGTITLEGMVDYLTAVFKTMLEVGGERVRREMGGATCEEIARETAYAVFAEADLNEDGTLSYEEWKNFYSSPDGKELQRVVDSAPTYISIAEVKSRTGLDQLLPAEIFEQFAHAADENGELSKPAFVSVFERIAPLPHNARLHLCIDSLFHLLDTNGDQKVDYVELSTGLSVLTGGSKKDKLASAFALLDLDGSGTIDREELERYVTSVYRIMYSDPESKKRLGNQSIEMLARATADEVMSQPYLRTPGQLTLSEFERWIEGEEGSALTENVRRVAEDSDSWLTIPEMARLTNMRAFTGEELFERFATAANAQGELTFDLFDACMREIIASGPPLSEEDTIKSEFAIDKLFTSLDTNKDGKVDFQELASGVSILAGGSRDDKVRAAFNLYDTDGNGYISQEEMVNYLLSVYRVLFQTQPDLENSLGGITAEQLAQVTTEEAFRVADTNHDGQLSFEEFRDWYSSDDGMTMEPTQKRPQPTKSQEAPLSLQPPKRARQLSNQSATVGPKPPARKPKHRHHHQHRRQQRSRGLPINTSIQAESDLDLAQASRITGLDRLSPSEAFSLLGQFANPSTGKISPGGFFAAIQTIAPRPTSQHEKFDLARVTEKIHQLFDADHDGFVDLRELAAGLTVLNTSVKPANPEMVLGHAQALFDVFSADGQSIRLQDLRRMLESVFRVMLSTDPASREIARGRSSHDLANAMAQSVLEEADVNLDGRISREEFQRFIDQSKSGQAFSELMRIAETNATNQLGLSGLKKITGLEHREIHEIVELLGEVTYEGEEELTRQQFYDLMKNLAPSYADQSTLRMVCGQLFEAIDVDDSQTLSFDEMAAGLSILCAGDKHKRAQDAFILYDLDGDGYISIDELFFFLRSVFRILKMCDPVKYAHIDVDELATATAEDMMKEADASGDGLISLPEFLAWTEMGGEVIPRPTTPAMQRAGVVDLNHARDVLGLANITVHELFEALAERADDLGEISRQDFKDVLMRYATRRGDIYKADALIDVLFETLDLNSNGSLDFSEVASGMSVMVGGDKMDKLKVSSQLFDLNGDGLITRDEMLTYLTSVFSVVLATQPEARARVGNIDAEALAKATCDEAFAVADLNNDGVLDFNEFAAWMLGDIKGAATARIVDAAPSELTLADIRKITGLENLSPEVVFDALANESDDNSELDRRAFNAAFQRFARRSLSAEESGRLRVVVNRMFDLFDADGNGSVSFPELAAGLSVLCSGTKEEKTRAAFQAFGDGEALSKVEVAYLLRSVFRVLLDTIPGAKQKVGVTADQLAEATAEQCFLEKDPLNTGYVTARDFNDFFQNDLMGM